MKKSISAYQIFLRDEFEREKKKGPVIFTEVVKKVSEKWRIMSMKEKTKYEERAKQER